MPSHLFTIFSLYFFLYENSAALQALYSLACSKSFQAHFASIKIITYKIFIRYWSNIHLRHFYQFVLIF